MKRIPRWVWIALIALVVLAAVFTPRDGAEEVAQVSDKEVCATFWTAYYGDPEYERLQADPKSNSVDTGEIAAFQKDLIAYQDRVLAEVGAKLRLEPEKVQATAVEYQASTDTDCRN